MDKPLADDPLSAELILLKTFESMGDAVVVVDRRSRTIARVNPAFERMFGYRASQVLYQSTRILYADEESFLRGGQESSEAFAQQKPFRTIFRMRRADGTVFETEHTLSPIFDDSGVLVAAVSVVQDRTEWNRAVQALAENDRLLSSIADNLPGAIYTRIQHPDGRVTVPLLRGRLAGFLGAEGTFEPGTHTAGVHPLDRERHAAAVAESARTLATLDIDVRRMDPQGHVIWSRTISQPRRMEDGTLKWDGIALDVTASHTAEEQLNHLSNFDQVTGLANRHMFEVLVTAAIAPKGRWRRGRAMVLALNLDRFKYINTTYGTALGDQLLAAVAERLKGAYSAQAEKARLGGDEFAVALGVSMTNTGVASALHRITAIFDKPFSVGADEVKVSASMGVAMWPDDGADVQELLRNAGVAMHRSRSQGGAQTTFYSAGMSEKLADSLMLEHQLRKAIEAHELVLHYQPQVDPLSGTVVGLEALVRWQHPQRGLVYPGEFIGVAEEAGLIRMLDAAVLAQACRQCRAWLDEGLEVVPVSVNVSAKNLEEDLFETLSAHLQELQLPPSLIQLEVTEGMLIQDPDRAQALFGRLRGLGIRLVLDDFGTGHSSLGYLRRFTFDKLKIDKSFVDEVAVNPQQACLVKAIIDMARGLHMETVAEGVETLEQLRPLVAMGCTSIQGWIYSKAVDAQTTAILLSTRRIGVL